MLLYQSLLENVLSFASANTPILREVRDDRFDGGPTGSESVEQNPAARA